MLVHDQSNTLGKVSDKVYGDFEITEPIILELLNCPAMQRLKGVDQAGYRPLWVKLNNNADINEYDNSRFAHSVGVYSLLYKYGAPLEEQIAGLIHDVSHSAFSHCIDYVLDVGSEKEQNHQDNLFEEFVRKTEIPEILKKYGFDPEHILNDKNFPLKEKELPDLCADRIDYSLRTAILFQEISQEDKDLILRNLTVARLASLRGDQPLAGRSPDRKAIEDPRQSRDNPRRFQIAPEIATPRHPTVLAMTFKGQENFWVFKSFTSAKKYAELFNFLNTKYYSGIQTAVMFRTLGDYIRYALRKKYINLDDLYTTDKEVLEKIKTHLPNDKDLQLLWGRMNNKVKVTNNPENSDAEVFVKSRIIDPLCQDQGQIKRVSDLDPGWKTIIESGLKPKQYFLKFEK